MGQEVIVWKTAEEVMKIIAEYSKLAAGMSIEEFAAAYGFTQAASGMYVKTLTDTIAAAGAGSTAIEAVAGATAAEAGVIVTESGVEVLTGTALTGGATTTAANLTLYTTAEGATAVGGLGSIALPIAACALAGAGGYVLGNIISDEIDKKYPEFFTGMFESVSEFLTGDEKSLAFIFHENGEAFFVFCVFELSGLGVYRVKQKKENRLVLFSFERKTGLKPATLSLEG